MLGIRDNKAQAPAMAAVESNGNEMNSAVPFGVSRTLRFSDPKHF